MHIKGINRKVIRGEFKRLEDLFKRQLRAIAEGDDVLQKYQTHPAGGERENRNLGVALHFCLYESQEVFLVHAARMVDVCINLADVVKIARGRPGIKEQKKKFAMFVLPMRNSLR